MFEVKDKKDSLLLVKIKNKINKGDEIEMISPQEMFKTKILNIYNTDMEEKEVGNTNDDIFVELSVMPENYKYALGRTIGIKNKR